VFKTVFNDDCAKDNTNNYNTPNTLNNENSALLYYNSQGIVVLKENWYIVRDNTKTLNLLITTDFTGKFKITVSNFLFDSIDSLNELNFEHEINKKIYYGFEYGNMHLVKIPLSDFLEGSVIFIDAESEVEYVNYLIDRTTGSLQYDTNKDLIDSAEKLETAVLNAESGDILDLAPSLLFEIENELTIDKHLIIQSGSLSSIITNKKGRAFLISSKGSLTLNNVHIKNCYVDNTDHKGGYGAGIYIDSETRINIYMQGILNANNCKFINNTASNQGGAIYNNDGIVSIKNSTFYQNKAYDSVFGDGGAIYNKKV